MRQIKFRGKRLDNGEWVIGDLITYKSGQCAIMCKQFTKIGCEATEIVRRIEVDPATVGQFTGLRDKNGTEIYEGDTLLIKGDVTAVVVWRNEGFDILDSRSWTSTNKGDVDGFVYVPTKTMAVIGNIYNNPELKTE